MNRLITVNSYTMLANTVMIAIATKLVVLITALLFMVLHKPSSLLIEHDGFIRFDERPLDRRLWQSISLQYLIIEPHQHFEL
jgi:hypothetical protein